MAEKARGREKQREAERKRETVSKRETERERVENGITEEKSKWGEREKERE